MSIERKATELFKNGPKSIGDRALLTTLGGVERIYSWGVNFWASMYESGHLKQHRLHAYTISVGNIVAGGTGKTPFVQYMARRLQKAGERVARGKIPARLSATAPRFCSMPSRRETSLTFWRELCRA